MFLVFLVFLIGGNETGGYVLAVAELSDAEGLDAGEVEGEAAIVGQVDAVVGAGNAVRVGHRWRRWRCRTVGVQQLPQLRFQPVARRPVDEMNFTLVAPRSALVCHLSSSRHHAIVNIFPRLTVTPQLESSTIVLINLLSFRYCRLIA